jgi:hypothetical protein
MRFGEAAAISYNAHNMRYPLATALLLAACAGPAAVYTGPLRISTMAQVAKCESAGVIEERIESPSDSEGLKEQIRGEVKKRAVKLHATDLVFTAEEYDESYAFAKAEAYICKK